MSYQRGGSPSTPVNRDVTGDTGKSGSSSSTGTLHSSNTSPISRVELDGTRESTDLNQAAHEGTTPEDHRQYRMVKKHLSLDDMWSEWHGIGQFSDDVGGIHGQNKLFGPKWRKHLDNQRYSRTKFVVTAISNYANSNKLKTEEAIAVMEAWWKEPPVLMSLTKMKSLCASKGLLKKGKMRGRHCKKQQQDDKETTTEMETDDDM